MTLMFLQMVALALLLVVSQFFSTWSLRHFGLSSYNAIEDVEVLSLMKMPPLLGGDPS